MDTSKDVAQATGAAEPVDEGHSVVELSENKPAACEPAAASATSPAPAEEPQIPLRLPPAASLPPTASLPPNSAVVAAGPPIPAPAPDPQLSPEPRLVPAPPAPPAPALATAPPVPPVKPARSVEPPPRATEIPVMASPPASPRRAPPIMPPPAVTARAGARRDGGGRAGRFAMLAALTALAAGLGGAIGTTGLAAVSQMIATPASTQQRAAAADEIKGEIKALRDAVTQTRASVKAAVDSVAALKASFDSAGKSSAGQFAKVNEMIARLSEGVERAERLQAEPAARLAKVIETLERLERRAAGMANETTGSISGQQPKPLGQPPQSLQQQQAQLQAQQPAPPLPPPQQVAEAKGAALPVIDGWVLHRVQGGVALIEGRYGMAEVEAGDSIRGLGRVQEIKRQDGRWVVVTARGVIVPGR